MYKLSPKRNHRSKGIKVKHVLQICLLLAVCFWLIYQVKHSDDKKREFDENDAELSIMSESSSKLVKHGRKDLQPRIEGVSTINEHREEPEEGKKPEEEDQEIGKTENKNNERGEGGEDDGDDHDQLKSDAEVDRRQEDFVDEDKERGEDDERGTDEERDSEDDDGQVEDDNSLEDHDHDEDSSSSHEAREENYKADDASSAVTHDTKLPTSGNENGKLKETTADTEVNDSENSIKNSTQISASQNTTGLKVVDIEDNGKVSSLNTTNSEEKGAKNISSNALDTLALNSTRTEEFTDTSGLTNHLTEMSTATHELSPQNRTQAISKDHNVTAEETNSGSYNLSTTSLQHGSNSADMVKNNLSDSILTLPTKSEGVNATLLDSSNVSPDTETTLVEKVVQRNASVGAVDNMELPTKNATEGEKSHNSSETETTNEVQETSNAENLVEVQNDPIDTDSSIHLEEKHVHTDLETLPEIQTEGSNSDDAAAE